MLLGFQHKAMNYEQNIISNVYYQSNKNSEVIHFNIFVIATVVHFTKVYICVLYISKYWSVLNDHFNLHKLTFLCL